MGNTLSYRKDFGLILIGAIIFTASFLWKDLFSDVREKYFPAKFGLTGRFMFTFVITIILVMIAVQLRNYFGLTPDDLQKQQLQFDDNSIDDE